MKIQDMMKRMGITAPYDTAKPQPWMDAMREQGFNYNELRTNFVWLYDEPYQVSGRPFNVRGEYQKWCEQNCIVIEEDLYEDLYHLLDNGGDADGPYSTRVPDKYSLMLSRLQEAKRLNDQF